MTPLLVSGTILQRRVLAVTVMILDPSTVNIALKPIVDAFTTGVAGLQQVVNACTPAFAGIANQKELPAMNCLRIYATPDGESQASTSARRSIRAALSAITTRWVSAIR